MSKFAQIFTVILIFGVLFAFPASAQESEVTKADLQKIYMQSLNGIGDSVILDEDDDIVFNFLERRYYIIIDEDNPMFFRIYREIDLGSFSAEAAMPIANEFNRYRWTKFYISERSERRSVAINTELLLSNFSILPNPQNIRTTLIKALNIMRISEDRFFSRLESSASSTTVSSAQ